MKLGLENQVAIVTGAGGDIGRAISLFLAEEGAKVVVVDINKEEGEKTVRLIKDQKEEGIFIQADVTNQEAVSQIVNQVVAKYGTVHILINVAGGARGGDILEIDEETFYWNLDLNLKSAYLCTKEVLPPMISQRKGAIVNISSVNATTGIGEAAYSAAKAGMNSLTQTTAVRYGPFGIKANALCLGTIDTVGAWGKRKEKDSQVLEKIGKKIPRKKVGTPEEVAPIVAFLASDASNLLNGAIIIADGGWTIAAGTVKEGAGEWYE